MKFSLSGPEIYMYGQIVVGIIYAVVYVYKKELSNQIKK